MTEHKFTDEEVIRALGCCLTVDVKGCGECPYRDENCINRIMTDALDLINRQKAEINSLEDTLCGKLSASAAAIIEDADGKCKEMERSLISEAVTEFAERLKTYYRSLDKTAGALVEYHIDQIAKEMLEGG